MTYHHGRHKMACERCGAAYLDSQIREEWTGAMVCFGPGTRGCWEPRHPQEFVKAPPEEQTVENVRTRNWVPISEAYPNGVTSDDL